MSVTTTSFTMTTRTYKRVGLTKMESRETLERGSYRTPRRRNWFPKEKVRSQTPRSGPR